MAPDEQDQTRDRMAEETNSEHQDEVVVRLHAEEVSVAKKRVVTGQVKVEAITRENEQLVEELLEQDHVEIGRTAISKQVDKAPEVREEGDTLIIPILEEIVVVERRLVLKEEVRIRRVREKQPYRERVVVRKQEAVITRL